MSNNVVIIVAAEVPVGTLLAVAKRAGTDVKAVVAGSRALADTVAAGGVASVAWIDVPEATPAEAFAGTVAEAVKALEPGVVLAPNAADFPEAPPPTTTRSYSVSNAMLFSFSFLMRRHPRTRCRTALI